MPGTPVGTTASGGTIQTTGATATVLDTLPSGDARSVLAAIPEPIAARDKVSPPPLPAGHPANVRSRPDTSEADAESEEPRDSTALAAPEEGDVPTPSPTRVLGDRPRTPQDSTAAEASPRPAPASPAPASPPSGAAPARRDPCWRVQVAAVPEPQRAEALRSAAQSQLGMEWVIEIESRLHKVRSKGCREATSAEALRRRAVDVGFAGAFKFQTPAR